MNPPNLTNKQLSELDSLFELVSQRQKKDFGNISVSNKPDGSLLTSCDSVSYTHLTLPTIE